MTSFDAFVESYWRKLYGFIYRGVNQQQVAEELTRKTSSLNFQRHFDNVDNKATYLFQMARNQIIDYYRQRGRQPRDCARSVGESGQRL